MKRCRPDRLLVVLAPLLALPALTGCVSTFGQAQLEQEAAYRADMAALQDQNKRLQGRIEGIELELDRLGRAVDALRSAPGGPSQADVEALQARIASLDGQIKAMDAAREKDRQEIINSLSAKIAQLVGSSGARSKTTAPAPAGGKRSGTQQGYEHVVEPGQTLSAIAAAYGVSSKAIIDANNLTNPDQLRVGQKLFVPAP